MHLQKLAIMEQFHINIGSCDIVDHFLVETSRHFIKQCMHATKALTLTMNLSRVFGLKKKEINFEIFLKKLKICKHQMPTMIRKTANVD